MAHNFPVPDEAQLERLIVTVYKRMPDAEFPRLVRIEERLARNLSPGTSRRKVNTIPWWIVILLTGGIVVAAWWAGDLFNDITRIEDNSAIQGKDKTMHHADIPGKTELPLEQEPVIQRDGSDRKDSPIIYQREQ